MHGQLWLFAAIQLSCRKSIKRATTKRNRGKLAEPRVAADYCSVKTPCLSGHREPGQNVLSGLGFGGRDCKTFSVVGLCVETNPNF